MSATSWLARRWCRRRAIAVVPLGLLVAAGTAGTVMALSASERTADAYREYLARANVADVVINPSTSTQEIDSVIRSLPNVKQVTTDVMLAVTNDDGQPRPRWEIGADVETVLRVDPEGSGELVEVDVDPETAAAGAVMRGSSDGRYLDMDRPAVQSGRMLGGPREAVLSSEAAEALGLGVGDVVPLAFWPSEIPSPDEDYEAFLAEVVSPLGVEQVDVVGIVTLPDEVLPDDLYPRRRVIVSPDVVARYECLPATPPRGSTYADVQATLAPADCAVTYRYYSVSFTNGAAGVKPALDEFIRATGPMNEALADISDLEELGAGPQDTPQYFLIPTETEQERRRVERSIRPTVTALAVLALAAAAVTAALAALLVARELRRTHPDQQQWHQLGVTRAARAAVAGLPLVLASATGVMVGFVSGWLLDPGPVGLVSVLEPVPGRRVVADAALAAVAVGAVVVLAVAALAAGSAGRRERSTVGGRSGWGSRLARLGDPAVTDGLRAATTPRTALPLLGSGALLSGALVAALVFGASLSALVSTPRSYGWPWQVAGITGYGYGDLDVDGARARFGADPDVAGWAVLGLLNEVTVNGEPMMTVVGLDQSSTVDLPLLRGSLPRRGDEVALGATVASAQGVDVGDTVELGGVFDPSRLAIVTGIVVFPTLGPFLSDRVGTGTGVLLAEAAFQDLTGPYAKADAHDLATFIGVELDDAADTPAVRERVRGQVAELDLLGGGVVDHAAPVRPPEIIAARSTQGVPAVVAVVVAAATMAGAVFASWASARARRRDLAVLRALGFDRRQVRRSVHVQSLVTVIGALLVGLPAGVIAGRVLWHAFAEQLGVVPDPASSWGPVLMVVVGGLMLGLLAALVPAQLAARVTPAEGLRTE